MGVMVALVAVCDIALAESIPLPPPRPAPAEAAQPAPPSEEPEPAAPSACFLRLTSKLAMASALPRVTGAGGCGAEDVVRLEAIVLADKTRVAVTPPAVRSLRPGGGHRALGARGRGAGGASASDRRCKSVDNYASYDCRGRNRVVGAKLSEHGKANALDMRSFKLANGKVVELTSVQVAKDLRESLKQSTCARFTTVLGPGSDGYHEDHVHVDLAERRGGYRMCQWDVREQDDKPVPRRHVPCRDPVPRPRPVARIHEREPGGPSMPRRHRRTRWKRNGAGLRPAPLAPSCCRRMAQSRRGSTRPVVRRAAATRGLTGESPCFGASTTTIEPILTRL